MTIDLVGVNSYSIFNTVYSKMIGLNIVIVLVCLLSIETRSISKPTLCGNELKSNRTP